MSICPKCGYEFPANPGINLSNVIKEMINKRDTSTRKSLKTILKLLKHYQSYSAKELYNFLIKIDDVPDNLLKYSLNQCYVQGYFETKNIHYLAAVILNQYKNRDRIQEVERKKFGSKPPRKDV